MKVKSDGESVSLVKDDFHCKDFHFNQVFGHLESQEDVYLKGCRDLVNDFTNGYNACCLCYGQSGTGKTHTIFGNSTGKWNSSGETIGVVQYALQDIFEYIERCRQDDRIAKLYVSFYEIYLETVRDLLIPVKVCGQRAALNIRECPESGTYIEGLSIFEVEDFESLYELMHRAVIRRVTREHNINSRSSRSHGIVRLVLEHEISSEEDIDDNNAENPIDRLGKSKMRKNVFSFGDLAGSERLSQSGSKGIQLKEVQNINKSISALGNCIQALAFASNRRERGGLSSSHIPYRDSKLTRLLADALSGNTKTYIISTVCPCTHSYTETLSTLTFASRASTVKKLVGKVKPSPDLFTDLSRQMYDWKWPAVYKKSVSSLHDKVSKDDTDWTYDVSEVQNDNSKLSSMTLSVNEFLNSKLIAEGNGEGKADTESHQHSRWNNTTEELADNSLLFALASNESREFMEAVDMSGPASPSQYFEEEKDWNNFQTSEVSDNFLDSNLYLSYPTSQKSIPSHRKAPPIPHTSEDRMIEVEVEKPLKSALKKPCSPGKNLDKSIASELDSLSGEIRTLRESLANFVDAPAIANKVEENDATTSKNDTDDESQLENIMFASAKKHDNDSIEKLERSIIGSHDVTYATPEEDRLHSFNIEEINDELDKINSEHFNRKESPVEKEIRFDLPNDQAFDSSRIAKIALNTSSIKRYKIPPPPSTPHPGVLHCQTCDKLSVQNDLLRKELNLKNKELTNLKEIIALNKLQVPGTTVKDDSTGLYF